MNKHRFLLPVCLLGLFLGSCAPAPAEIAATIDAGAVALARQTIDARPSATPQPTYTPRPTLTPAPTYTPLPAGEEQTTLTPRPTYTPAPTYTPEPSWTPPPTAVLVQSSSTGQGTGSAAANPPAAGGFTVEWLYYTRGLMRDVANSMKTYTGSGGFDYKSEGNFITRTTYERRPADCPGVISMYNKLLSAELTNSGSADSQVQAAFQSYRSAMDQYKTGAQPVIERCQQAVSTGETFTDWGGMGLTFHYVTVEVETIMGNAINQLLEAAP